MIDFDDIVSILKLFGPEGIYQHFSEQGKKWRGFLFSMISLAIIILIVIGLHAIMK